MNLIRVERLLLIAFLMVTFGTWISPMPAEALTLTPTRFELSADPGETIEGEIVLINENAGTETFYPTFADFEAQGDSGVPAFIEPATDLGAWIKADTSSVTLAGGEQKTVPFTISVPANAEPGGHFAVVFWGTSPSGDQGRLAVGSKIGTLVLLSVNGEVKEDAGLLDFKTTDGKFFYQTLPVGMEYRVKNDGGDRIKPAGTITVRNTLFLPTDRLDANPSEGNVLPSSIRKIKVDWINSPRPQDYVAPANWFKKFFSDVAYQWKNFAVGLYSAKLNIAYGSAGEKAGGTVFFFVFPWQLVLVILVVISIVFIGGRTAIRRYNRWIIAKSRTSV